MPHIFYHDVPVRNGNRMISRPNCSFLHPTHTRSGMGMGLSLTEALPTQILASGGRHKARNLATMSKGHWRLRTLH